MSRDDPASRAQTYMIRRLGGGDVRDLVLTRGEAHAKIRELMVAQGIDPDAPPDPGKLREVLTGKTSAAIVTRQKKPREIKPATDKSVRHALFEALIAQSIRAANEAGATQRHDNRHGQVFIHIRDRRTAFAKYCLKRGIVKTIDDRPVLNLPHKYVESQYLGVQEACAQAIFKLCAKNGIKGIALAAQF